MKQIFFLTDEKEVTAESTETILNASLRSGIPHTHVCGGHARCSTCRVMLVEGLEQCDPRNEIEQKMADQLHFDPAIRLACQTTFSGSIALRRLVLDDEDIELDDQTMPGRESSSVGKEKRIAILFSDIRGFTSFSESMPAYDVIHLLNRYFHLVGRVIADNGGYIDNYMGDGIMALFGVDETPDASLRAVKAGLEMLDVVEKLKPYMMLTYHRAFDIGIGIHYAVKAGLEMLDVVEKLKPYMMLTYHRAFDIGIGIHYGEAVVGTIGARERKTETAIGDSVNFASWIESAN